MVYHPNEFDTLVTLGQNEPLYCNVPDFLLESLARVRLGKNQYLWSFHYPSTKFEAVIPFPMALVGLKVVSETLEPSLRK